MEEYILGLSERYTKLRNKRDALKKALEEKMDLIREFNEDQAELDMASYNERYDAILGVVQKLSKTIIDELKEFHSYNRKWRYRRWVTKWTLWIFGLLLTWIVNFFSHLSERLDNLNGLTNNPEKVLEHLEDFLKDHTVQIGGN